MPLIHRGAGGWRGDVTQHKAALARATSGAQMRAHMGCTAASCLREGLSLRRRGPAQQFGLSLSSKACAGGVARRAPCTVRQVLLPGRAAGWRSGARPTRGGACDPGSGRRG